MDPMLRADSVVPFPTDLAGTPSRAPRDEGELQSAELLEALPAAVYTTDAAGRITFFNDAAAALWGCRPELGKSEWCGSWRLYWPDGRPLPHGECPMAIALKEKRPIRGAEAVAERPDGTRVPFLPYPTPLFDESGALAGAVNVLVDITERKEAEKAARNAAERFYFMAERMPQKMFHCHGQWRCRLFQPAMDRVHRVAVRSNPRLGLDAVHPSGRCRRKYPGLAALDRDWRGL